MFSAIKVCCSGWLSPYLSPALSRSIFTAHNFQSSGSDLNELISYQLGRGSSPARLRAARKAERGGVRARWRQQRIGDDWRALPACLGAFRLPLTRLGRGTNQL